MSADAGAEPEEYVDGSKIWWRWYAPVEVLTRTGFVDRATLVKILGYKPKYNLRGFGEAHSGLQELDAATFEAIRSAFVKASPPQLPSNLVLPGKLPVPGAGESAAHRSLKNFVAEDPATVLGELGLCTLQTEYPFGTGDRADIVLTDRFNRIVGVEVEPTVGDTDHLGPLQAIKYRRMLEWVSSRMPGDSRSFLVAYEISKSMRDRCRKYGVECFEIPLASVQSWTDARLRSGVAV